MGAYVQAREVEVSLQKETYFFARQFIGEDAEAVGPQPIYAILPQCTADRTQDGDLQVEDSMPLSNHAFCVLGVEIGEEFGPIVIYLLQVSQRIEMFIVFKIEITITLK